jgi:hypothetical protein
LFVGLRRKRIAAVAYLLEDRSNGGFFIIAAAIARRFRGRGGALTDQMMREVLALIDDRAVATRRHEIEISGRITSTTSRTNVWLRDMAFGA